MPQGGGRSVFYGSWFDYPIGGAVTIHGLSSSTQPQNPYAGLTLGIDGNLYGATVHGGGSDRERIDIWHGVQDRQRPGLHPPPLHRGHERRLSRCSSHPGARRQSIRCHLRDESGRICLPDPDVEWGWIARAGFTPLPAGSQAALDHGQRWEPVWNHGLRRPPHQRRGTKQQQRRRLVSGHSQRSGYGDFQLRRFYGWKQWCDRWIPALRRGYPGRGRLSIRHHK